MDFYRLRHRSLGWLALLVLAGGCLATPATGAATFAPTILPISQPTNALIFVSPDHTNWTYELGAPASFRITVEIKPFPPGSVPVTYRLGPEMREGAETDAMVPEKGLLLAVASPSEPGFIRCIVTTTLDGKSQRALATVGFAPEKITPTQTEPADFDAFWAEQKPGWRKFPPIIKSRLRRNFPPPMWRFHI